MRPAVLAVTSDQHCGSTLGLCPPEGVKLDDGGRYDPSIVQRWLWECWEDFWGKVDARCRELKATRFQLFSGDAVEGDHHGTSQILSRHPGVELAVAQRAFAIPKRQRAKRFVVRGTEVHVGKSGGKEEALADWLRAEPDPTTETASWWELWSEINGFLIQALHHGGIGRLPWTATNILTRDGYVAIVDAAKHNERWPDLVIRSHFHQFADSEHSCPTRVIQTPGWQIRTAHGHRVARGRLADIGGVIITLTDRITVEPVLYRAKRSVWKG
jgi:hypothetical protein